MTPSGKQILAHFEKRWGEAERTYTFATPQIPPQMRPLRICEFALRSDHLTMYSSIGMSRNPMPKSDALHRVEIFMGSFQENPLLPQVIAMLATYPFTAKTFVGVEHTVPFGSTIIPTSRMTAFVFCRPFYDPQDFWEIKLGTFHIQILWAIPIYESERQFKIRNGWDALRDLFERKGIALGDFEREPAT